LNNKLSQFIKTSILGGFVAIVPLAILAGVLGWFLGLIKSIVSPATLFIMDKSGTQETIALVVAVAFVVCIFFLIGAFVRTRMGAFFHNVIEERFLNKLPFYKMIKEIIVQFFGSEKSPFSKVALVSIFNSPAQMTAFVTDETVLDGDDQGESVTTYTVFVPTGPNPTSGNIYHLPADKVQIVDVPIEVAMKSIIACGSGSQALLK